MNRTNFNLVKPSPWPFTISWSALIFAIGFISRNHYYLLGGVTTLLGFIGLSCILRLWCRDLNRESVQLGYYSFQTKKGLSTGFIVYMISETFFFVSFIWSYFYISLDPSVRTGGIWPPFGISGIYPWSVPLLNTFVLLSSGATLTWSHNALLAGNRHQSIIGLIATILLGVLFSFIQASEYYDAKFTLSDSAFGTLVFSTLTLHGLHVRMGLIWLSLSLRRLVNYTLSIKNLLIESAIIFRHIIDIIRIILFIFYYVWAY
jgi:cytochrome c oxidase subunit 3